MEQVFLLPIKLPPDDLKGQRSKSRIIRGLHRHAYNKAYHTQDFNNQPTTRRQILIPS